MPSSSPTNGDECIFRQYRPTTKPAGIVRSPSGVDVKDRFQQIMKVYEDADQDMSGGISLKEWEQIFGDTIEKRALRRLFEQTDTNRDGQVSVQEFKELFVREGLIPADDRAADMKDLLDLSADWKRTEQQTSEKKKQNFQQSNSVSDVIKRNNQRLRR
jgi:hypothetical protein